MIPLSYDRIYSMNTTLMECPKCRYAIDVETYEHNFTCIYCRSRLHYDPAQKKLFLKIDSSAIQQQNPQNSNGNLFVYTCKQCGALVPIYNPERSHSFLCKQCGSPLYWGASPNDIQAKTERTRMHYETEIEKKKIERDILREKEKTKRRKMEIYKSFAEVAIPILLFIVLFILIIKL